MKGEHGKAIKDSIRAIEIDPEYASAYSSRGLAYHEKREYDSAIADFTQAVELEPEYARAYLFRGHSYHRKGSYTRAAADYARAWWLYFYPAVLHIVRERIQPQNSPCL